MGLRTYIRAAQLGLCALLWVGAEAARADTPTASSTAPGLVNGDLEAFGPQAPETPLPPEHGWSKHGPLGTLSYNSPVYGWWPVLGDNYGSLHSGGGEWGRVVQTVVVGAGSFVELTGYIAGCSANFGLPVHTFDHSVTIWDGDADGRLLASYTVGFRDQCGGWVPFRLVTPPTDSEYITVEWGFRRVLYEYAAVATHVDELVLTVFPPCNAPQSDVDGDGDVDLEDFGVFLACFNGPNRAFGADALRPQCRCADADEDTDVDLSDFGVFVGCFNGPNRPAAC